MGLVARLKLQPIQSGRPHEIEPSLCLARTAPFATSAASHGLSLCRADVPLFNASSFTKTFSLCFPAAAAVIVAACCARWSGVGYPNWLMRSACSEWRTQD